MEKKSGVLSGKHTMDLKLSPDMKDFISKELSALRTGIAPKITPVHILGAAMLSGLGLAVGNTAATMIGQTMSKLPEFKHPIIHKNSKPHEANSPHIKNANANLYSLDKYAGINFEDVMVKQAFLGGVLRGAGALGRKALTAGKALAGGTIALGKKVKQVRQAAGQGIQSHVGGAQKFVKKNLQAGFEGNPLKPGISYGKAVSTERGAITRRANQTALQTAANERKAALAAKKLQTTAARKGLKAKGTQVAEQNLVKTPPNQRGKMTNVINERINQRTQLPGGPTIPPKPVPTKPDALAPVAAKTNQPTGPSREKINKLKGAPLSQAALNEEGIVQKSKRAWEKLTPTQKNIAKGTGAVAVGAGATAALMHSKNKQQQQQQQQYGYQ